MFDLGVTFKQGLLMHLLRNTVFVSDIVYCLFISEFVNARILVVFMSFIDKNKPDVER